MITARVSFPAVSRALILALLVIMSASPLMAAQPDRTEISWLQPTALVYGTAISVPASATINGQPVAGSFTYTPPMGTVLAVGTTRITALFTPATGSARTSKSLNIKVDQATLTVTGMASKSYGAPVPALVPTYSGLVNGDTTASVLTGMPTLGTTATATSVVGTYPITVAKGSLKANKNYKLSFANGTLTVTAAQATVTLASLAHVYDGSARAATVTTVPAGLATIVTYAGGSALPMNAGSYAVVATVTDPNHAGSASGSLVIAKAAQTITFAALQNATVGDAPQPVSASASSGLPVSLAVSGPAQIAGGALQVLAPGTVSVTATQAGDANHAAADPVVHSLTAQPGFGSGTGLLAAYFANETLSGAPALSRTDALVDFDWTSGAPAAGLPADSFSVRWDGEIEPRFSEPHTVTVRTDDGVRVWLDGQLVVNDWNQHGAADSTFTFMAEAGRRYTIRIEYFEHFGAAVAKLWWQSASETRGPIPTTQLHPTPPPATSLGTGTGLLASYFANETLAGVPAVQRLDATVDFSWAGGSPAAGIPSDSFSARWIGEIQPRFSGACTLTARTDDGVRMWLDGQLVIDTWYLRGAADSNYTFIAEAGRHYAIRMEYYEHFGDAVAKLWWQSDNEPRGPVPASQLYPAYPAATVDIHDLAHPLAVGETAPFTATSAYDGPGSLVFAWTQVSGPAAVVFQPADQTGTSVRFPLAGSYVLQLVGGNSYLSAGDTTVVTVVEPDVSNGLVAHYAFDEGGGIVALDSSDRQHTGTVVGASRSNGKSRGALHFSGTSYVYAMANEDLDAPIEALTLSVWLKPDSSLAQMAHPWPMPIYRAQYEDSTGYALMATGVASDQFGLRLHHQSGAGQMVEANTSSPLSDGSWIHVAGVYDGATATLYIDGVAVQSVATGPMTLRQAPDSPLFLGYGFQGLMDEVRIYHRALARTDVYGLAQDGSDRRVPGVDAGPDQVVTLPAPATLAGTASDDAAAGTPLVPTWTQISGPAAASFSNVHSFGPTVTFSAAGSYHFQLAVSDGILTGRDEMRIEVTDGSVDLVSGLVRHYRCDEATGTLVADASGNGQDGTFLGTPQWSDGQYLGAVQLDGFSNVTAPSSAEINGMARMTLSLWMRADRSLLDMAHPFPLAINHADYSANRGFALMTTVAETNTFGFRLHTGTGRREVAMDGIPSGSWVHVVGTFDGQAMRLYRGGVLVGLNATGPLPLPALDAPLQLGEGFEGLFDDVRIYDRALSPTEVQALTALPPLLGSG
jgi:hypothetical protein